MGAALENVGRDIFMDFQFRLGVLLPELREQWRKQIGRDRGNRRHHKSSGFAVVTNKTAGVVTQ